MRTFSILSAVLVLVTSANAAFINKREVTAAAQACINAITTTTAQITASDSILQSYTRAQGYAGTISFHSLEQNVESNLQASIDACCAVTTTLSEEDSSSVIASVGSIVPATEQMMNDFITKYPEFNAIPLMGKLIKQDIINWQTEMNSLDTCLVAFTPQSDIGVINGYVDRINISINAANATYINAGTNNTDPTPETNPAQSCIDSLQNVTTQITATDGLLQSFTSSKGYAGTLQVHSLEQTVESSLKTSVDVCCAITTALSEENAAPVITAMNSLVPETEQIMNDFITKYPEFNAIPLMGKLIKQDIINWQTKMNSLDTCLVAFTPQSDIGVINEYVDRINTSINAANAAYISIT